MRLYILIDLGNTHNFLSEQIAYSYRWSIREVTCVHVTIANGYELQCKGMYAGLEVKV